MSANSTSKHSSVVGGGCSNLSAVDSGDIQYWKQQCIQLQAQTQQLKAQKQLLQAVLAIAVENKSEQFQALFDNLSNNSIWKSCIEQKQEDEIQQLQSHSNRLHPSMTSSALRAVSHLYLTISSIPPPNGQNLFHSLPFDVFYHLTTFLSFNEVTRCECVCKQWSALSADNYLWHQRYEHDWPEKGHITFQKQSADEPWKQQYLYRYKVRKQWMEGTPNVMTLAQHSGTIHCLLFDETRLFSGADDGSLVCWNFHGKATSPHSLVQQHHKNTKMITRHVQLNEHSGPIFSMDYNADNQILVTGSYDKTINCWNTRSWHLTQTLRGHQCWVSSVKLSAQQPGYVVSAGYDGVVKLWSLSSDGSGTCGTGGTSRCLSTLEHDRTNVIYCAEWLNQTVYTGTRQSCVQQWDLHSGTIVNTYLGHLKPIYCMQCDDTKIVTGSVDHTIRVFDPRTGVCELVLRSHTNSVMSLQFDSYKLVSASYDKSIKIHDLRLLPGTGTGADTETASGASSTSTSTGGAIRTLEGHSSAVFCVRADQDKVISGAADNTIRVWDYTYKV